MELAEERPAHLKQPFLCCVGSISSPGSYFLIVDRVVIPCGESSVNAFKNLYASFYVFHLQYPMYLNTFYAFFDEFVFQVKSPHLITPSVASLVASLQAAPNIASS